MRRIGLGIRHVVLEAGADGIGEAVAALEGALALGMVRKDETCQRKGSYLTRPHCAILY